MEWCTFAIIIHLRNLLALKKEKEVRLFLFFCSVDPLSITTDQLLVIQNSRPLTRYKIRRKCSISSKINFNLMEKAKQKKWQSSELWLVLPVESCSRTHPTFFAHCKWLLQRQICSLISMLRGIC